jgi:hypothetical protein
VLVLLEININEHISLHVNGAHQFKDNDKLGVSVRAMDLGDSNSLAH